MCNIPVLETTKMFSVLTVTLKELIQIPFSINPTNQKMTMTQESDDMGSNNLPNNVNKQFIPCLQLIGF